MTAEEHNKTLATLYAIYGGLHGLGLAALVILAVVIKLGLDSGTAPPAIWIVIIILMAAAALFTVPPLIVAYGLKQRSRWAKGLAIVSSVPSLVNIPIGTALSIYTFKFFKSAGGAALYGGKTSTASEQELQDALSGNQPLMDWAKRVRQ